MNVFKLRAKVLRYSRAYARARRHPYVSMLAVASMFMLVSFAGILTVNAQSVGPTDKHLVELHLDGESRTIVTRASTVEDLLERLDLKLTEADLIEPGLKTKIEGDGFDINIYRAVPVTIADQDRITVVKSAHTDPRAAANAAGFKLDPKDSVEWGLPDDRLSITKQITITRAHRYQLDIYGQRLQFVSNATNPARVLDEAGVNLGKDDQVTPDLESLINDGDLVKVVRFGTDTKRVEEIVRHDVVYRDDDSQPRGYSEVITQGKDGLDLVVYEVTLENQKPVSEEEISRVTIVEAETEVVLRGTNIPVPVAAASSDKQAIMAAAGIAAADYGYVDFIITKESTWRPAATNSWGCIGLGQNCPDRNGYYFLKDACPNWQNDPVCQLKRFTGYAEGRYGGWADAYNFWVNNGWW